MPPRLRPTRIEYVVDGVRLRAQLTAVLEELVQEATVEDDASRVELSCDDIRSIMTDRLKGKPTRANFRTGHLTVCTLVPMRSIPHRVVCLLGLDDGSFPRHIERDGDDLTACAPRVGDRPGERSRGVAAIYNPCEHHAEQRAAALHAMTENRRTWH